MVYGKLNMFLYTSSILLRIDSNNRQAHVCLKTRQLIKKKIKYIMISAHTFLYAYLHTPLYLNCFCIHHIDMLLRYTVLQDPLGKSTTKQEKPES